MVGVVIYILVDNLIWPVKAKRNLRIHLAESLDDFKVSTNSWHNTYGVGRI